MIRVLLADDHAIVRAGLKEILADTDDVQVAGEAGTGSEVMERVRESDFDVVVLDMTMPGRSGIELIKQVRAECPKARVLVLSMHEEEQYAVRAIRAGASGYLTKDSAADQLMAAIRRIAKGGAYISPETAERLVLDFDYPSDKPSHSLLSNREFEVFCLLAEGRSVTQIGVDLRVSVKTISTHKARIMQKMKLANHTELVRYALDHKILDQSDYSA